LSAAAGPEPTPTPALWSAQAALADAALAKVRRHLLPFLFVLYIVNYMDRINVGFASLRMNHDLGLSDAVFGVGAGLFFIGYFIFEIPSNLILARVGARTWIARIMVTWGLAAIAMMFVRGARSFYTLRFLLGAAEAGFFPGVVLYLGWWFPERERARAIALFMTATAIAGVVVGPISGALLMLHGFLGIKGWQWLFAMQGFPAMVLGIMVAFWLPDRPDEARWLSASERGALAETLSRERALRDTGARRTLGEGLLDARVWLLATIYFGFVMGVYGVNLWLPQIVKGFGLGGDFAIGVITAIPSVAAAICMVQVGRASDRSGERRRYLGLALTVGSLGLLLSAMTRNPYVELAAISISFAGISSALGPFWAIPNVFLGGAAAAGGIALINSLGNLGGFVGPTLMGYMKQTTGGFAGGLALLAVGIAGAASLSMFVPRPNKS
jgi:MFS transporter, ACS family, tartrate transporter